MAKNKQLNLIAIVEMLNIGFINKHIINLGRGGGAIQYYLITIHLPQFFFISPFPIMFLCKI